MKGRTRPRSTIKAATQPARSLASVAPNLPPALIRFVDKALASEKRDRWPDAATMRSELEKACFAAFGEPPNPLLLGRYATPAPAIAAAVAGASTDLSAMGGGAAPVAPGPRSPPGAPSDRTLPISDPRSERELAAAAASLRMAGSTTTGGVDAPAYAVAGEQRGRSPLRWLLPAGVAVLLATGLGVAGYGSRLFKATAVPAATTSGAPSLAAASPSTSTTPGVPSGAPTAPIAPASTSVLVSIVAPPEAKVEVDGSLVEIHDGRIEIKGAVGTVHPVRVMAGGRESRAEVAITESGPVPTRIDARSELASARGAAGPRTAPPSQASPPGNLTGTSPRVGPAPAATRFSPAGL